MKKITCLFSATLAFLFSSLSFAQQWGTEVTSFSKSNYGISNLSLVGANTLWGAAFDSVTGWGINAFTKTVNGGDTWTSGRVNINNADSLLITFIDGINKDTAWVTMVDTSVYGGSIYKTTNGGSTWTMQGNSAFPMFSSPWGYPNYIHFFNDSVGVCIGDSNGTGAGNSLPGTWEIYTTSNSGNTWNRVPSDSIPLNMSGEYGKFGSFAFSANSVWFGTSVGNIYKSSNRGAKWSVSTSNLTFGGLQTTNSTAVVAIAMDSLNGMATDGGYYASTTDGGVTWTSLNASGDNYVNWLCYIPGTSGNSYFSSVYGYTGDYNGTSMTTDMGASWTLIDTLSHGAMAFYNSSLGWSGGFGSTAANDGMFIWSLTAGISPLVQPASGTLVFPNPMNDKAVIQLQNGVAFPANASLLLMDELGNNVNPSIHFDANQIKIEKGNLSSGIYFYSIITPTAVLGKGKIILY